MKATTREQLRNYGVRVMPDGVVSASSAPWRSRLYQRPDDPKDPRAWHPPVGDIVLVQCTCGSFFHAPIGEVRAGTARCHGAPRPASQPPLSYRFLGLPTTGARASLTVRRTTRPQRRAWAVQRVLNELGPAPDERASIAERCRYLRALAERCGEIDA